uniref:Uncharacterized protein n=1 Tax=Anguilla anguilla TaxID=7936 RepID=A0A0E9XHG6_ANGAN
MFHFQRHITHTDTATMFPLLGFLGSQVSQPRAVSITATPNKPSASALITCVLLPVFFR